MQQVVAEFFFAVFKPAIAFAHISLTNGFFCDSLKLPEHACVTKQQVRIDRRIRFAALPDAD
jgi:hypothetical protein